MVYSNLLDEEFKALQNLSNNNNLVIQKSDKNQNKAKFEKVDTKKKLTKSYCKP